MTERIKVVIHASGAHPDVLTVQDAMRQVLDIFDLLSVGPDEVATLEWKLAKATTNSPFHLEGEAVSLQPTIDVSVIARAQKQEMAKTLREITQGRISDDIDPRAAKIAKRIFSRNLNGVGCTSIDVEAGEPIVVTPTIAHQAIAVLEKQKPLGLYDLPNARDEIGSVEGALQDLGTHWNHPAIRIFEHKTRSPIWCRLNAELIPKFSNRATFSDIWEHRRVIVRGLIKYAEDGSIYYVLANDVQRIEFADVSLDAIRDPGFTGGLSTIDYLNRFRGGSLG